MEQKLSFLKNMKKTDKYLILLGVGILVVVLSWPSGSDSAKQSVPDGEKNPISETVSAENYEERIESRLEEILSRAEGAGKVEVMVTLKSSEEKIVRRILRFPRRKVRRRTAAGPAGSRRRSRRDGIRSHSEAVKIPMCGKSWRRRSRVSWFWRTGRTARP